MVFLDDGIAGAHADCPHRSIPLSELAISAAVISAVVIIARFIWVFPAVYLPRWLSRRIRRRDPAPPWQHAFVLAFTGGPRHRFARRSIGDPIYHDNRSAVPRPRSDPLPDLLRDPGDAGRARIDAAVGDPGARAGPRRPPEHEADKAEECEARRQAALAAINRLDELTAAGNFSEEILRPIRVRQHHRLEHIEHGDDLDDRDRNFRDLHDEIEFLLIAPSVSTSMSNIGLAS